MPMQVRVYIKYQAGKGTVSSLNEIGRVRRVIDWFFVDVNLICC